MGSSGARIGFGPPAPVRSLREPRQVPKWDAHRKCRTAAECAAPRTSGLDRNTASYRGCMVLL